MTHPTTQCYSLGIPDSVIEELLGLKNPLRRHIMPYINGNPKTKKVLKEMVAAFQAGQPYPPPPAGMSTSRQPRPVTAFQPGPAGLGPDVSSPNFSGDVLVEGPHYPAPHTWYARVTIVNGVVVKVK